MIPEIHANHPLTRKITCTLFWGYFFAKIASSLIGQADHKIGIHLQCLDLIVHKLSVTCSHTVQKRALCSKLA